MHKSCGTAGGCKSGVVCLFHTGTRTNFIHKTTKECKTFCNQLKAHSFSNLIFHHRYSLSALLNLHWITLLMVARRLAELERSKKLRQSSRLLFPDQWSFLAFLDKPQSFISIQKSCVCLTRKRSTLNNSETTTFQRTLSFRIHGVKRKSPFRGLTVQRRGSIASSFNTQASPAWYANLAEREPEIGR